MLDDLLLLLDDLVLLRVIGLGRRRAGHGGVQRADAVSTTRQLVWKLQLCSLPIRRMLLTWRKDAALTAVSENIWSL